MHLNSSGQEEKQEKHCVFFREELRKALGGQEVVPDDWTTTVDVIRETGKRVIVVTLKKSRQGLLVMK